jgi:hypothetical protein
MSSMMGNRASEGAIQELLGLKIYRLFKYTLVFRSQYTAHSNHHTTANAAIASSDLAGMDSFGLGWIGLRLTLDWTGIRIQSNPPDPND